MEPFRILAFLEYQVLHLSLGDDFFFFLIEPLQNDNLVTCSNFGRTVFSYQLTENKIKPTIGSYF